MSKRRSKRARQESGGRAAGGRLVGSGGDGAAAGGRLVRARALAFVHQPLTPHDAGQQALARRYGVDGVVVDHHWPAGEQQQETLADDPSGDGRLPYALRWVEDGRDAGTASAADDEEHAARLIACFRDPRYIRVDGRPLLLVDRPRTLADPQRTAALWRERAREAGIGDLLLVRVDDAPAAESGDPAGIGFDAALDLHPDAMVAEPPYRHFTAVATDQPEPGSVSGSSPSRYAAQVEQAAGRAVDTDADPVVFVDDWAGLVSHADLDEGSVRGHELLQAHAAALGRALSTTDPGVRRTVEGNLRVFRDLEGRAVRAAAEGRHEEAFRLARAASDWAWNNHPGVFSSPALEAMVRDVADSALPPFSPAPLRGGGRRRVLHVLTEGYAVGGHTRLAWRWMQLDASSVHSVAFTDQEQPLEAITSRVLASGGEVTTLSAGTWLDRAARLRALGAEADLVVLHVHPHDVVAALAFSGRTAGRGPRTLLMNHADHVFWLGVGAADVVVDYREVADSIAADRRGIDAARCVQLPVPLERPACDLTRAEARQRLGLPQDARILLTMAAPYKYFPAPAPDVSFFDLVLPVVRSRGDVVLLAVGPGPDAPAWKEAAASTGGRVLAIGPRDDVDLLRRAADVYVDSYPCASGTSLLEAALSGLPAVSYTPHREELAVVNSSAPGLAEHWVAAESADAFQDALRRLLQDPRAAQELGASLASAVAGEHCDAGWREALERVYALSSNTPPAVVPPPMPEVPGPVDHAVLLLHLPSRPFHDVDGVLTRNGLALAEVPVPPDAPASALPVLSVVLAVEGDARATVAALRSVVSACAPLGQLDLVVVDNASQDGTQELLNDLGKVARWVRLEERAPATAVWTTGLQAAASGRVLLLSNDVRLDSGSLGPLLGALVAGRGLDAVAPVLVGESGPAETAGLDTTSGVCLLSLRYSLLRGVSVTTVPTSLVTVVPRVPAAVGS